MKHARFFAHGHYHEGTLAESGILLDEAGQAHREDEVIFLPPVVPHSVIGLALNFADHATELAIATPEEPALFFKPPNTWIGHRAPVIYPAGVQYMHYEVELAVVIGQRLHHLGFWMSDAQSILRTCDVLAAAGQGAAIERGPGRHGISNAFFLYLRDPDGHRIELYTSDYFTGDPDFEPIRWTVDDPRRGTLWGHIAPTSWFEESSLVMGLDGNPMPLQLALLKERPMTVI